MASTIPRAVLYAVESLSLPMSWPVDFPVFKGLKPPALAGEFDLDFSG